MLVLIVTGSTLYGFGYAHAVWRRARLDWRKTKQAVPVLRKDKWAAWRVAVKAGFWIALAGFFLIAWVIHDVRGGR